jgi:hypothetical protein
MILWFNPPPCEAMLLTFDKGEESIRIEYEKSPLMRGSLTESGKIYLI